MGHVPGTILGAPTSYLALMDDGYHHDGGTFYLQIYESWVIFLNSSTWEKKFLIERSLCI